MPYTDEDIAARDGMGEFFRARGIDCLPSSDAEKKPLCRFKEYWTAPTPFDLLKQFPSPNIQVILGRAKGLVVFDLDGPEAVARWRQLSGPKPRTWVVHSGAGGQHWWYRIAKDYPHPLPKAVLWTDGEKHSAIERLCDKSLAMAPPSIHPRTGNRYRFLDAYHSHIKLPMPASCPSWLLQLPDVTPKPAPMTVPLVPVERRDVDPSLRGRYHARDVTEAIPDIRSLTASWGIRYAPDNEREWMPCHAFDREDRTPSAAVSRKTGAYVDKGSGLRLGLFDLAATLGFYRDWKEAVDDLGERFRARKIGGAA